MIIQYLVTSISTKYDDVIDYILRECIKREQPIRKCKNC